MASLTTMSYADMDLAIVPEAPPAWKNSRATSWPAPISASVPYFGLSKFMVRAFCVVVRSSLFSDMLRGETRRTALRQWPSPPRQWCSVSAQDDRRHLDQVSCSGDARRFLADA